MRHILSANRANLLYLTSMLLVVTVGSYLQTYSLGWGLLATEFFLILLPALAFLRWSGVPVRSLGWHWPGLRPVLGILLVGAGAWMLGVWLEALSASMLGYVPPTLPGMTPNDAASMLLVSAGLALAAPLCEEVLFRGAIQPAYASRSPRQGILVGGLLFAFFHLRFQGLVSLLPVSFLLGFVYWRSRSLWSSILLHYANNSAAAGLLALAALSPGLLAGIPIASPLAAGLGLLLIVAGLVIFNRSTHPVPAAQPAGPPLAAQPARPLLAAWPLVIAGLIFIWSAVVEIRTGREQAALQRQPVRFAASPISEPTGMVYELQNHGGQTVGQAACQARPGGSDISLYCQAHQAAFELQQGNSYWSSGESEHIFSIRWQAAGMELLDFDEHVYTDYGSHNTVTARRQGDWLEIEALIEGPDRPALTYTSSAPPDALLPGEWAWRMPALPFETGYVRQAPMAYPSLWQNELNTSAPALKPVTVTVTGQERLSVPAGDFTAWNVRIGSQSAWYDSQPPHTLLRYESDMVVYLLVESGPVPQP